MINEILILIEQTYMPYTNEIQGLFVSSTIMIAIITRTWFKRRYSSSVYDVAIIGGGPGGYVSAIKSAQLGLKALHCDLIDE